MVAISVVGLGKLGAPMAAVLASAGHRVIGVDLNDRAVRTINEGRAPVSETGLDDLMRDVTDRLSATTDVRQAVANTDVTFVIVATPSEPGGEFSLKYALPAMQEIGAALAEKDGYHLVVLTSTVMPGTTGGPVRLALETASGKQAGVEFGLCYSPEFIALGSVIRDLRNPDFLLIGESDPRAGDLLLETYTSVCENDPPSARMNYTNAEITKLAVNTFVTTKISYANMLAQVCERLPSANVDVVTSALGMDSRIGPKYLKGGAGYGGPCFPRDNRAFAALAADVGADAWLAQATDRQNVAQVTWVAAEVRRRLRPGERVAVLGLAYKTNTNIAEESHGLNLTRALAEAGIDVVAHDFAAVGQADGLLADLGDRVTITSELAEDLWGASVIVVATPWSQYRTLLEGLHAQAGGPVVLDCWRLLSAAGDDPSYIAVGVGRSMGDDVADGARRVAAPSGAGAG